MPRVIGVDVSLGRGLDVALLESNRVVELWDRVGQEAFGALLKRERPEAVGIDAPPSPGLGLLRDEAERASLQVRPPAGRHLDRRVAEYELSRRGIGSHQTPPDEARLFSWMKAGFETFRTAAGSGYPAFLGRGDPRRTAFEVFPYASYVAMAGCLSPGRRWRLPWRRAVLEAEGIQDVPAGATIDALDATCAALTAGRFLDGHGSWLGDPREGAIVLPVGALKDRYHRCVPPAAGVHEAHAAGAPRLCECGCAEPVRRRFLPGHDSKLKSRLLRDARAGDEARAEMKRLGWAHLLKEE